MLRLRQVLNRFEAGQEIAVKIQRTVAKKSNGEEEQADPLSEKSDAGETAPDEPASGKKAEEVKTEVKQITMTLGAPPAKREPDYSIEEEEQVDKPKVR